MRYETFRAAAQAGAIEAERTRTARARLQPAIDAALAAVLADQRPDGHWVYELEADVTIPAEYVLMVHYLGETPDADLERKIARYLRRRQGGHGGWPLFHGGAFDTSASVKAYFALKMIGDAPDAPHMVRAREAIRAHGGAERILELGALERGSGLLDAGRSTELRLAVARPGERHEAADISRNHRQIEAR